MNSDYYLTIEAFANGIYREKGSKFLAFAYPVSSLEEIKTILEEVRKKYFDARHVCYAYVLGKDKSVFRVNDDGEPSSTAGKPILGQINSLHLTNVLVVVVRYFGGILLGTSGLIVAYRSAAADALSNATIVEREITVPIQILHTYDQFNIVEYCESNQLFKVISRQYCDEGVSLTIQVHLSNIDVVKEFLGKNNIKILEQ